MRSIPVRSLLMVTLFATALLAGCTEPASPGEIAASGSASSSAPEAVANESFGAIMGLVVDDEGQPLQGAVIQIVETLAHARSDEAGRFTFNELPAGTYGLVATRVGYEQATRKVDVVLDEATSVTFTLAPIVIPDAAYHVSVPRVALMHVGHSMLTWPLQDVAYVNVSAVNALLCEGCQFVLEFQPRPKAVLTEATWPAGTAGTNADIWISHYRNRTGPSASYAADYAFYLKSGAQANWTKAKIDLWGGWHRMHVNVQGGLTTVNVEHRIQLWYTFGYNDYLPDGFTALPR